MIVTLIILVFVVPVLCGASFVLGVLTGYPTRKRQRHAIAVLSRQLSARTERRERQRVPINVTVSQGVPVNMLMLVNPASLSDKVIEHWREQSAAASDDDTDLVN